MSLSFALSPLDEHVIGRERSIFAADFDGASDDLAAAIEGSSLLVLGGAGSIGSSTLHQLVAFGPRTVHVIDHNENGLAELVRSLRSSTDLPPVDDLLTLPFDIGGAPFRLWLESSGHQYDHVLNFAALKHVRSEKDPYSILAMLETNVYHLDRLASLLAGQRSLRRAFSVSTDKAANPTSMMGATKRLMEHALFSPTVSWPADTATASARFANVAFSNGSLLQGWQNRLAAAQPLACPEDCRRYFVSMLESGHLCALASMLNPDRSLAIPALEPDEHLVLLTDVAVKFLDFHGYEAYPTRDPHEAVGRVSELAAQRRWPLLLTPLDTGGEKPYEEFAGDGEPVVQGRFSALREVMYRPPADLDSFPRLVAEIRSLLDGTADTVSVESLRDLIAGVEPAFADSHRASDKSLDQRI